jgi:hypothetical protein
MVVGANFSSCFNAYPLFTYSYKCHNTSRLCAIINRGEVWHVKDQVVAIVLVVLMVA